MVTFTEKILNRKLYFLCSVFSRFHKFHKKTFGIELQFLKSCRHIVFLQILRKLLYKTSVSYTSANQFVLKPEAYSEPRQTSKMECFQEIALYLYTRFFYKQHFYKQHQAQNWQKIGKKSSKC